MTQTPTKRDIIIEHLADAFLQNGLGHTGLRGLGALAGTCLLYTSDAADE